MTYENLKSYSDEAFKRYCGVTRHAFEAMVEEVTRGERMKRKSGRPSRLSLADQVLLTLQYWREYRTFFHLGASVGLHESSVQRIVTKVENRLLASGRFTLPRRDRALALGPALKAVIIDATETPIERPKKSSVAIIAVRKNATR